MVINQKLKGRSSTFEFNPDSFRHKFSDGDQTIEFKVPYSGIDIENPIVLTEKNVMWKFVTIPVWFLVIMTFGKVIVLSDTLMQAIAGLMVVGVWLICIGLCYFLYSNGQVTLMLYNSVNGRVTLICDGKEESIVNELTQRASLVNGAVNDSRH
ncbi:hypothetical protein EMM73_12785 [Rheinheimera sediminis]|uniref:hypothetical protein n=1 Tax=Rheinheimera sp. YQF-1 TaxID=2499626 RepID=UPI000FDADAEE|nr:hypothetical protein [Rheinheimera sp. YQF-1]RVT45577.1 hypothetical protein EMM73_12785 [Rheinheimera sp. YQF-1]